MNKKAKELGLKNTHFITPHGLDEEEHYTTAYELALIADYALNNPKISEVVKTKTYNVRINNNTKAINNTNELLGCLEGVNGVKTGFTNGAGRCLVTSVERDGFNIITVVLGADTKKIRTKDSIKLIEYIYSNYELVNLEQLINEHLNEWKKINEKRIYIYKGKKNSVGVNLEECKYKLYPIKKDKLKNISVEITNVQTYFEAPVNREEEVGILTLNIGNEELVNLKLLTNETVERKNIKDYIFESLKSMI
jgi:D-alanyl-D-alanine carboxypeptidase (penicillin-binding protein 5/6)